MKLIKQSFEFINQTDFSLVGIKKHIEKCARVSYKSEDKITDTSYEKFVNMLESRGHDRPLEFGTVYLDIPTKNLNPGAEYMYAVGKYHCNPWSIKEDFDNHAYISTNYRVIKENHWEDDLQYLCEPTEHHHKRYTVHMILDRGVMDEFRTHVGLSHLAESTRYCNYSKDKFGNEVTFIIPSWCNPLVDGSKQEYSPFEINGDEVEFMNALQNAQNSYLSLLKMGWTPQQARSVLPLGIKSELISCGFEDAWKNFFDRRCAADAHPMAREIAIPMKEEFKKQIYFIRK
nr:MAG TPA: Thymidylate synthase complementing protein [Crassvirales sp.]